MAICLSSLQSMGATRNDAGGAVGQSIRQVIVAGIRQEVAKLDPELPLSKVSTIQQAMDRSLVTTRLTNWLLAGFAATALLLALTGIYGVMSLNVANRRNEFGIRLALGAQATNVLQLILGQGLRLAIVGVAAGCWRRLLSRDCCRACCSASARVIR